MLFVVAGSVHGNNRALTTGMCRDPVPARNFQDAGIRQMKSKPPIRFGEITDFLHYRHNKPLKVDLPLFAPDLHNANSILFRVQKIRQPLGAQSTARFVSLGETEAQPLQVVVDWAEHIRQITPVRFFQAEQKAAVILCKEL